MSSFGSRRFLPYFVRELWRRAAGAAPFSGGPIPKIILFDRVGEENPELFPPSHSISFEFFRALVDRLELLGVLRSLPQIAGEPAQSETVTIVFGGGWAEHYNRTCPFLIGRKLPFSVAVTTAFVESRNLPWRLKINYYVHRLKGFFAAEGIPEFFPEQWAELTSQFTSNVALLQNDSIDSLIGILEAAGPDVRGIFLASLIAYAEERGMYYDLPPQHLTWDMLGQIAASGVPIISQFHSGASLDQLSSDRAVKDAGESAVELGKHGIQPASVLVLPDNRWPLYPEDVFRRLGISTVIADPLEPPVEGIRCLPALRLTAARYPTVESVVDAIGLKREKARD